MIIVNLSFYTKQIDHGMCNVRAYFQSMTFNVFSAIVHLTWIHQKKFIPSHHRHPFLLDDKKRD